MLKSEKIQCPLVNREIDEDYCWELCILLDGDIVENWDKAHEVCKECRRYNDDNY